MGYMKIDYVEFGTSNMGRSKAFFRDAFGWGFADYGPDYQAFEDAGIDGGLDATKTSAPLVILKAEDLGRAEEQVVAAGGQITREPFAFPGGRRFHFREPGGNELAVWSER